MRYLFKSFSTPLEFLGVERLLFCVRQLFMSVPQRNYLSVKLTNLLIHDRRKFFFRLEQNVLPFGVLTITTAVIGNVDILVESL